MLEGFQEWYLINIFVRCSDRPLLNELDFGNIEHGHVKCMYLNFYFSS